MTHAAIHIVGDGNFTSVNGVIGGQGTPADPFVIAGWNITAQSYAAVWVQDTRAYFVVRDVAVRCANSYVSGMSYQNVTDGRLQNVSIRKCYPSIDLAQTSRMSVTASNLVGPAGYGLQAANSDNLTVEGVNVTAAYWSLSFRGGQNLTLQRNRFAGNLSIWSSRDVLIESNAFDGWTSIATGGLTGVRFLENNFTLGGIYVAGGDNVEISRNRFGPLGLDLDCTWGSCDTLVITADNLVNEEPLLFFRAMSDLIVDGVTIGEAIFANCTRARVSNLTFHHSGPAVIVWDADGFEIRNVSVEASGAGAVSLVGVRNATLSKVRNVRLDLRGLQNATLRDVANGSWLSIGSSSNLSVEGSVFTGVSVEASANVTLRSNEVTAPFEAFAIVSSTNTSLLDNDMSGNGSALDVYDSPFLHLSRNRIGSGGAFICIDPSPCDTYDITPDNFVNNRPLLFYRGCSDEVVNGIEVGEVILLNCTRVRLVNLSFAGWSPSLYGARIPPAVISVNVEGLEVANLTAPGLPIGWMLLRGVQNASVSGVQGISAIRGDGSRHLDITNNSLLYPGGGIYLEGTSDVVVSSNTMMGPYTLVYGSLGFGFSDGDNLTLTANHFPPGSYTSLWVAAASNVTVEGNAFGYGWAGFFGGRHYRLENNTWASGGGIGIFHVDDAALFHNGPSFSTEVYDSHGGVAVGNDWRGRFLDLNNVTGWTLYNNSFSSAALDDRGPENRWDDGYPTGGNLWMDYKGVDKCRGPAQDDCTAGDGIGDTPYVIDDNSTDRYPFMPPPVPPPPSPPPPANNLPPVASITAYPTTALVGQDITFVGTDSYDPDGRKDLLVYRWDFGDGTNSTQEVAIHAYSVVGHYSVTLTVWDLYNAKGTASVNVTVVVSQPPTSVQLLPFQLWDGYRLPLPIGWSFRLNATVGNRTYDIFLDGLYNDTPVTLAADSQVEAGIQETPSTLQAFAQKILYAARSTDADARFLVDPETRTLSNHAGVVFTVVYPRLSVFQEFAYVVSATSSRSWVIFMSGSLHDREYLAAVFERILAGFAITLIEVKPPDLTPLFFAIGGGAAVLAPVAYLAYSQRKRPRRGTRRKNL